MKPRHKVWIFNACLVVVYVALAGIVLTVVRAVMR